MNKALLICFLAGTAPAFATALGDTYAQVTAEKGPPIGTIGAGSTKIVTYPDAIIKISGGVVVSVRAPSKPQAAQISVSGAPVQATEGVSKASPTAYDGPAVWQTDFKAALEQAQSLNRHVLVLYTGSDWCSWCHRMEAEVYSQPEFARYAHDKLVLLKLDYPRHTPQAEDLHNQNGVLLQRYNVHGFPTALLVDANGAVVIRFDGYQEGGAARFVGALKHYE
ncbi:MAG TPA: thioredoxin family protein [Opitutaceae bacterium]